MSNEFKKPEHKIIDAIPYLTKILGNGLIKDLHDNEVICPECQGTGLTVNDNPYGLSGDPNKKLGMFPYKHQSIRSCQRCYNGILHVCLYCGKLLDRRNYQCDCEGAIKEKDKKEEDKNKSILDKAIKLNADDEIAKNMPMFYSDNYGYNERFFSDWDEFFDYWNGNYEDDELCPEYVWGTVEQKISIDADRVIENATDDLWEGARDNISREAENELQTFLDIWCEKQLGTTTYYMTNKYAIKIPWELNDNT